MPALPSPIPDDKRDAITAAIQAGDKSRAAIAQAFEVSPSTVTNIAKAADLTNAFDRSKTKKATAAQAADNKALRTRTSRRFLEKCNELLDQMDQPHIVFNIGGKDNVYTEHVMERPPTGDLRNLMVSAATAFDKHLVAERHDADDGNSEVASLLGSLLGGLQAKHGTGDTEQQ